MFDDLAGKAVLITGAGSGIGAAVAKGFSLCGARVAIHFNKSIEHARTLHAEIVARGGTAVLIGADLMKPGEARRTVEEAAHAFGGLDILVNNAGSLIRRVVFAEWTPDLYDDALDLNVRPVIEASQAAIPSLEKSGSGAIINVGSIAGNDGGGPGAGHYAAAKAYVHALTRHMARDLAARAIRVNAIAPGTIATPFHRATPPERMEAMRKATPLGRLGEPEDCVGPVLFLASPAMSGFVTGQILHVNGGQLMP
jgi:3-oxoacyl-[acyl-carrier protein] reductase